MAGTGLPLVDCPGSRVGICAGSLDWTWGVWFLGRDSWFAAYGV